MIGGAHGIFKEGTENFLSMISSVPSVQEEIKLSFTNMSQILKRALSL